MQLDPRLRNFLRDYRGIANEEANMVDSNSSFVYPALSDGQRHNVVADRIKLRVPYAGTHIPCEIMLESAEVFDIIVDPQFNEFAPTFEELPSLFKTEPSSSLPQRLVSAVHELCAAYKRYSLQKLRHLCDMRSQFAANVYDQLTELGSSLPDGLDGKHLEVAFMNNGANANSHGEWIVFIQVKLIFIEQIVRSLSETRAGQGQAKHDAESSTRRKQPGEKSSPKHSSQSETAARRALSESSSFDLDDLLPSLRFELRAAAQNDTLTRCTVSIAGEKQLEALLGGTPLSKLLGSFQFPTQTLRDFMHQFVSNMSSRVQSNLHSASRKRDFFAALLDKFGSLIECDTENFRTATFLINTDADSPSVLFSVSLQAEFPHPKEPPVLQLATVCPLQGASQLSSQQNVAQSLAANGSCSPYVKEYRECPYSPRWTVVELTERIRIYLNSIVPEFLNHAKFTTQV